MLYFLIPLIAFLYASVGFGGATGYLAAMSFFGIQPQVMASTALLLNVLVASISFSSFYRAGHLRRDLLIPFVIASVPAAFLGGSFKISDQTYSIILYSVLTFVAIRLLFFSKHTDDESVSRNIGSLGIAVMTRQFWRQLNCRPPAVQLLAQPPRQIPENRNISSCSEAKRTQRAFRNAPPFILATLIGFGVGLLSGIVGIGGGIFLSPIIIFSRWGTSKQASAVSAAFIVLNSISGLIGRLIGGALQLDVFSLSLIPLGLLGALAGSYWGAFRFSGLGLRRALGAVMTFAASNFWWMLFK